MATQSELKRLDKKKKINSILSMSRLPNLPLFAEFATFLLLFTSPLELDLELDVLPIKSNNNEIFNKYI